MKRIVLALLLASMMPTLTMADEYCDLRNAQYFGMVVRNDTNQTLHLDLGDPRHGRVDTIQNIYIAPHTQVSTSACSDESMSGLETYVRLYGDDGRYLDDWHVWQHDFGMNTIRFHDYTGECQVSFRLSIAYPHGVEEVSPIQAMLSEVHAKFTIIHMLARCH